MIRGRRKTAFIGFLCAIQSTEAIFDTYVRGDTTLKYLLTYKLSQDHLELFFAAVRSSCGSNNNPTARQYSAAYKRLLMRHEVQAVTGNCKALDNTHILFVTSNTVPRKNERDLDTYDVSLVRQYDLVPRKPLAVHHDYADLCNGHTLSVFKEFIAAYIAGYVVRMVTRSLACKACTVALTDATECHSECMNYGKLHFFDWKNKGGLTMPSLSTIRVCESTERCLQRSLAANDGMLPQVPGNLVATIQAVVLTESCEKKVFESLQKHMFDTPADNNHVFTLIKLIAHSYCKIKTPRIGQKNHEKMTGLKVRKQLSKLVLFKHQ